MLAAMVAHGTKWWPKSGYQDEEDLVMKAPELEAPLEEPKSSRITTSRPLQTIITWSCIKKDKMIMEGTEVANDGSAACQSRSSEEAATDMSAKSKVRSSFSTASDAEAMPFRAIKGVKDGVCGAVYTARDGAVGAVSSAQGLLEAKLARRKGEKQTLPELAELQSITQKVAEESNASAGFVQQRSTQSSDRRGSSNNGNTKTSSRTESVAAVQHVASNHAHEQQRRGSDTMPCMSGDCILITSRATWALLTWPFAGRRTSS
mmetsp:Transcript_28661/g.66475  ORF Transcript_28661/g.66475 Transcript_28661/m.66475 type:complete len:262 (-) Transcript_28661:123-908(-)